MMDPEDVIGRDAVLRLQAAGFRIVPRPTRRRFRTRYTCPVCGFSALGGQTGPVCRARAPEGRGPTAR